MDNNDFIKDWLEGKVTPEELKSHKVKGDLSVQELEELISRSSQLKMPESITKEDAWKKLTSKITSAKKEETKVIRMNHWIPISIAASITLALTVAFFMFSTT